MADFFADKYAATAQVVAEAIRSSIEIDRISVIETKRHGVALHEDLLESCDDYVQITAGDNRIQGAITEVVEYWGVDADGNSWRVHLHIRQD